MVSIPAKINRSSTLRLKLGALDPHIATPWLMGTSATSAVITRCQRAAAESNAARCVAVIAVV
jgi:hypothetical protein